MDENGKVRPNCANAANPYHVCGAYCLEKIAGGKGYKENDKKILDNRYGIKEVVRDKRTDDGGRSQLNCPKEKEYVADFYISDFQSGLGALV